MSEEKQKPCDLEDHDAKGTTNIRTINKYKQTSYQTASVNDPVWIQWMKEHQQLRKHTQPRTEPFGRAFHVCDCACACACACAYACLATRLTATNRDGEKNGAAKRTGECWMLNAFNEENSAFLTYVRNAMQKNWLDIFWANVCTKWELRVCSWSVGDGLFMHAHVLAERNGTHNAHINQFEFMRSYLHTNYDYFDPIESNVLTSRPLSHACKRSKK